jgi:hypothetical protein
MARDRLKKCSLTLLALADAGGFTPVPSGRGFRESVRR